MDWELNAESFVLNEIDYCGIFAFADELINNAVSLHIKLAVHVWESE